MRDTRGDFLATGPAWRVASLPCVALLGIALPLTFASVSDQFLYDFRTSALLPIYATGWLVLAVVAIPVCAVLALGLRGLEVMRSGSGRLLARGLRIALIALAAALAVDAVIYCLQIWVGTFDLRVPVPDTVVLLVAAALGLAAAVTARGRAAVRSLATVGTVITLLGLLSLASLPPFGWHAGRAARTGTAGAHIPVAAPQPAAGAVRPNILLLTLDALSAQHMSLYGAARPTTPQLAAFAQGATTFDRAYANGNFTTPGIASILTGTRPWTHRALQLPVWPLDRTRRQSLPALLQRAGYRMGYVSTNVYAGGSRQGFGAYFQFTRRDRIADPTLCTDRLSAWLRFMCAAVELPPVAELEHLADRFRGPEGNRVHDPRLAIDPALAWLRTVDQSKPVFLWVHLFPPHSPYAAPRPWLGRFDGSGKDRDTAHTQPSWAWLESRLPPAQVRTLEARYDESVAYVDHYAGQFLRRALEQLGPDTVVVVTADHGESFGHGYGAHTGPGLYDEIIHIPLIIKLPGQTAGHRSDALAEQIDIAPTLAELAGIKPPATWEGRSLLGECSGAAAPASHTIDGLHTVALSAGSSLSTSAGTLDGSPAESSVGSSIRPSAGTSDRNAAAARSAASPSAAPEHAVFSMSFEQNPRFAALRTGSVAVIQGRWKLVHYMGALHYPFMPPRHDELYDLSADPHERSNLAAQQPGEVRHLRELIAAALARHGGRVH